MVYILNSLGPDAVLIFNHQEGVKCPNDTLFAQLVVSDLLDLCQELNHKCVLQLGVWILIAFIVVQTELQDLLQDALTLFGNHLRRHCKKFESHCCELENFEREAFVLFEFYLQNFVHVNHCLLLNQVYVKWVSPGGTYQWRGSGAPKLYPRGLWRAALSFGPNCAAGPRLLCVL